MLFRWTPNFIPRKIFIFGCGGTGSRVVPLLAQFVKSCPWVVNPELHIFDFDEVEPKNLLRQNFIQSDVGKNKAVVLANRYSKAFSISITPYISKLVYGSSNVKEASQWDSINEMVYRDNRDNCLFIMCVDTPGARREIVKAVLALTEGHVSNLIIDAGNENDFGQVTISGMGRVESTSGYLTTLKADSPVVCDIPWIPMDSTYYDEMVATTTPSCADLDQTMAINTMMAVNIFGIVQNVYYVKPITFFRLNISMQHGAIPQNMDMNYLRRSEIGSKTKSKEVHARISGYQFNRYFCKALDQQEEFEENIRVANEAAAKKKAEAIKVDSEKLEEVSKLEALVVTVSTT